MAVFYGQTSRYELLMRKIHKLAFLIWCTYSIFILSFVIYQYIHFNFSLGSFLALCIVFGPIYFIADYLRRKDQSTFHKFSSGLRGETAVWYELHRLNNAYHVFEDITLPGHNENIDFVVFGPTGIFTVEVKNHTGNIGYNGEELTRNGDIFENNFIKRSMDETLALHTYIANSCNVTIFVTPIVVFSNYFATLNFSHDFIRNIHIIKRKFLISTILSGSAQTLSSTQQIIDSLNNRTYNKRITFNKK